MKKKPRKKSISIKSKKRSKSYIKAQRTAALKTKNMIIETLENAREEFKKRLAYNKDIKKYSKDPIRQATLDFYYKDTIKTNRRLKLRVEKLLKVVKSNKYGRITKKVLARFQDAWKVSGHIDKYGYVVSDQETAFKNMILVVLKDSGIDITDPRELNKALQGMDMSTIYRVWKDKHEDDEDTFYEQFSHNPLSFLKSIKKQIRSNKKYQRWQASKAKKLLKELDSY